MSISLLNLRNLFYVIGFNIGFFGHVLPVVISVDREIMIRAELFSCETAISLFLEYGGPLGKIGLVKFLFGIHEIFLCD